MYKVFYSLRPKHGTTIEEAAMRFFRIGYENKTLTCSDYKIWYVSKDESAENVCVRFINKIVKVEDVKFECNNKSCEKVIFELDDNKDIVTIDEEYKKWYHSIEKEIKEIYEIIEYRKKIIAKYEIIYGEKSYSGKETYLSKEVSSLDVLSDWILEFTNFNKENFCIPSIAEFNIEKLNDNSIWMKDFRYDSMIRIKQINREIPRGIIWRDICIADGEKGCIFSTGAYTNGIKHCSNEFLEWLKDINEKIKNIDNLAIEKWNFIE